MAKTFIFICSLLLYPIKLMKPRTTRYMENLYLKPQFYSEKSNLFLTDPESQELILTQNYAFMKKL